MRIANALGIALLSACALHATPVYMWIGTYTIENYSGNGGGASNLSYPHDEGDNFFSAASVYVPSAYRFLNVRDGNVTRNVLGAYTTDDREQTDFVFFSGHGSSSGPYLGSSAGYGSMTASNWNLGMGWGNNRWFINHACSMFNRSDRTTYWNPLFKGLQALLSFQAISYDHNRSWDLFSLFWEYWQGSSYTLWDAYKDAEYEWGYSQISAPGLYPGCMSASGANYCGVTYANATNSAAANGAGNYYSSVMGTPQY